MFILNRCLEGATKYDYEMKLHGIGLLNNKQNSLENGHCTQACVFIRRGKDRINVESGKKNFFQCLLFV